ncbi:MAG: hypothetical protein ACLTDC_14225 [Lachnospiraceae bacterium]
MHISNRKQFAGRALKMIAFVLLTVLLLVGMSKTLVPRSNSASGGMHNYRARGFMGKKRILWMWWLSATVIWPVDFHLWNCGKRMAFQALPVENPIRPSISP